MSNYKTKQKDLILTTIKKQNKEFTIKDIYDDLKDKVGLTTIYRMVDELVTAGTLSKTIDNLNVTKYCYLAICPNHNHFYLKCDKCGHMIHIDCDCIEELSNHIVNNHNFLVNKHNIIIGGLCESCLKKVKKC